MNSVWLLSVAIAIACFHSSNPAPAPTTPLPANDGKDDLKENNGKILAKCQKNPNKCKGQTDECKLRRAQVKDALINQLKQKSPSLTNDQAEKQVEQRLAKLHQMKKKIHEKSGLSEVEPCDDGLWQDDMVLSEDQTDTIIKHLDNPSDPAKKKRSASIFFEDNQDKRWTMPVHYWIDPAFNATEASYFDEAVATLTAAVPCIKFAKDTERLTTGAQLQYVKDNSTGCGGHSMLGFQGINVIVFGKLTCPGSKYTGKIIHETIHSLGGGHEQNRADRGKYVEIFFGNIEPQKVHAYRKDKESTSYGVPYDYNSIMHYVNGAFASESGLDTIRALADLNLDIGTKFVLTGNDTLQLTRMYCKPSNCFDADQSCGTSASIGWCVGDHPWVQKNCRKSCGFC